MYYFEGDETYIVLNSDDTESYNQHADEWPCEYCGFTNEEHHLHDEEPHEFEPAAEFFVTP